LSETIAKQCTIHSRIIIRLIVNHPNTKPQLKLMLIDAIRASISIKKDKVTNF